MFTDARIDYQWYRSRNSVHLVVDLIVGVTSETKRHIGVVRVQMVL